MNLITGCCRRNTVSSSQDSQQLSVLPLWHRQQIPDLICLFPAALHNTAFHRTRVRARQVVRRAVCAFVSAGTMNDAEMLRTSSQPAYVLALLETTAEESQGEREMEGEAGAASDVCIGVALVDAASGRFIIGQVSESVSEWVGARRVSRSARH